MSDPLGFLIGDVARLVRRRFDESARAIGVTRPQWRVLTALNRVEGIHQGALADRLEVEPITLCRMIDRLEEAELVERRRAPSDRRAWHLYLTPKSRQVIDQLMVLGDELSLRLLEGIPSADQEQATAVLERMRLNMQQGPTQETAHG